MSNLASNDVAEQVPALPLNFMSSICSIGKKSFGPVWRRNLEVVPNERVRYTDKFDDPNLPGEMTCTVVLKEVFCGTEINITQEGIPAVIPAEARGSIARDSLNFNHRAEHWLTGSIDDASDQPRVRRLAA